MIEHYNMVWSM